MLVTADQLSIYGIEKDYWFARRTGSGTPISRDQYFINYSNKLQTGMYCAIGNDTDGWELEQYDGVNWKITLPDESYKLVITSNGLKAVADTVIGGYKLTISGVKIIDQVVPSPSIPFIEWTDDIFLAHGNVKFSVGTVNSPNKPDSQGLSRLREVLSWKYNSSSGGIQYCLNLPTEGLGAFSDDDEEEWDIGTIGLYIKDKDGYNDILFAVATLPSVIKKYANNEGKIGNRIKLYFNTVLSNLGFVSNLEVMEDGNQSLPEVPNETLLFHPTDNQRRAYNCYLVDNLFGSNMPALAVPRPLNTTDYGQYSNDWAYFQPSINMLAVNEENFADSVNNYQFVYWDSDHQLYELAEGRYFTDAPAPNNKMPIGIRVGNNIIYSGEVVNFQTTYKYKVELYNGGSRYSSGDILNVIVTDNLVFRIEVTAANRETGEITDFALIGPCSGGIKIEGDGYVVKSAVYDYYSQLPRNGGGARFRITDEELGRTPWNFPASWLNKPVYCNNDSDPGNPTLTVTDCFLGWVSGTNSIRLGLDLRNEASTTRFGTTRYATDTEVRNVVSYPTPANASAVTPQALYNNYLPTKKGSANTQLGSSWTYPVEVETNVWFKETILGKNMTKADAQRLDNANVDFVGRAYRAEWADLAEYYESDEIYEPGTLITFGAGDREITKAQFEADGVISSKPGLQLGIKENDYYLPVALTGRVPVLMDGNSINYFGDKIYLSRVKPGAASTVKNGKAIGKIVDRNPGTKRLVECVVRIDFDND